MTLNGDFHVLRRAGLSVMRIVASTRVRPPEYEGKAARSRSGTRHPARSRDRAPSGQVCLLRRLFEKTGPYGCRKQPWCCASNESPEGASAPSAHTIVGSGLERLQASVRLCRTHSRDGYATTSARLCRTHSRDGYATTLRASSAPILHSHQRSVGSTTRAFSRCAAAFVDEVMFPSLPCQRELDTRAHGSWTQATPLVRLTVSCTLRATVVPATVAVSFPQPARTRAMHPAPRPTRRSTP